MRLELRLRVEPAGDVKLESPFRDDDPEDDPGQGAVLDPDLGLD
jgi:hypothetical protein